MKTWIAEEHSGANSGEQAPDKGKITLGWILEYVAWLFAISVLALIIAISILSPAFADISGSVKATKEKGFGRIIIDFSDLPKFQEEIAAGILVLSFDKTVSIDVENVAESVPSYVEKARLDPDGKAIRFALKRSYQVNIMEAGSELFVDLLPPDWKGLPPPLPAATIKALTEKAIAAERRDAEERAQREAAKIPYVLKLRAARHPTFNRIVFDWNKFVTFDLSRKGRQVLLTFDKYSEVDLTPVTRDRPKFLHAISANKKGEGLVVRLTVDEDVDVRGFREEFSYVLDLTGPDALAEASAAALAEKAGAKKKISKADASPKSGSEETVMPGKRLPGKTADAENQAGTSVVTKDIDPAILSESSFTADGKKPPANGVVSGDIKVVSGNAGPRDPGKTKPVKEGNAAVVATAQVRAHPKNSGSSAASPAAANDDGLRITFQFAKPVAAAIFRRGNSIWAVFDSDDKIDVDTIKARAGSRIVDIRQVSFGDAQYVLIKLKKPQLAHAYFSGNGWHLAIGDMISGETTPLKLVRALRDDNRSIIKVKMKDYGRVHWLTDPDIGDRLAVVTALPPQRNLSKPQEFVDFSTFPTAHGLAIRPRTDDVAVRLHLDEVLITRREGLTLSAGNASQYVPGKKPLRKQARIGFIEFGDWSVESPGELSDKIHDMQRVISNSPQNEMNARRFDLATLYTANHLFAESLGLLHRMVNVDADIESDPAFRVLRGATLVLMGRLEEASRDFEIHALANDGDAALWRGLIESGMQNWDLALTRFDEGRDFIEAYRADLQARFRLAAVRAALEINKLSRAATELNAIQQEKYPDRVFAELNLLTARYLDQIGRSEEAADAYMKVLDSSYQPAIAEARLYATLLDMQKQKIDRKEALTRLERLQLFWRGDDIELRTIRVLANLYVREKRHQDAFMVMRNALEAFPDERIALQVQDDMKQVFKNLFLHGEADGMEPVQALSLYYGYRELTPVGRLGDEMIRRLSDRLVEVDLLDQASELLEHQVHKRLKGAARAQVATRLAMVYLLNHKADLALRSIRQTRQAGLPEDLKHSRNLLEARALGELGRAAAAVEILNTMDGESVEQLKADAYWVAQDWKNVGHQLERLLSSRWNDSEPLSKEDRFNVLRAAIGYSMADDQFALDRLRKKFYPKLLKTPDAEAFLVVTKPIREKGVAFRNLAKQIAAIDTLDGFMKEFKARYDGEAGKPNAGLEKPLGNSSG